MDQATINKYEIEVEAFAEGMKFGAKQTLKWFLVELAKETQEKKKEESPNGNTI